MHVFDIESRIVATAIRDYHAANGAYPHGGNENVINALRGKRPPGPMLFDPNLRSIGANGELLDAHRNPYQISLSEDGAFVMRSAGRDRVFWTADDKAFTADLSTPAAFDAPESSTRQSAKPSL